MFSTSQPIAGNRWDSRNKKQKQHTKLMTLNGKGSVFIKIESSVTYIGKSLR